MKKSPQNNSISSMEQIIQKNPAVRNFKRKAKALQKSLQEMVSDEISLRKCQDLVVQQHGYKHWHQFSTTIKALYVEKNASDILKYEVANKVPAFVSKLKPVNLGYSKALGMHAWLDKDFLKNHLYLQGDARNTIELHLIQQMISDGHPVIYMDGEANKDQLASIKKHVILSGREHDLRTLSFDHNSSNPFETNWYLPKNLPFSFHNFTEIIVSFIDIQNPALKARAIFLISVVLMILTYMRDKEVIILDWELISDYLRLDVLIKLHKNGLYGADYFGDLPKHLGEALRAYLVSIPGYDDSTVKQNDTVIEQHGYFQMVLTKIIKQFDMILPSKGGHKIEEAKERIDEFFNGNQIFILSFPNINEGDVDWQLMSQFFLTMLKFGIGNKLIDKNYNFNASKAEARFVFIKSCTLPTYFATVPAQLRALNTCMILSYKDDIYTSVDEARTLIANSNIKMIAEESGYKLIVKDTIEDVVL